MNRSISKEAFALWGLTGRARVPFESHFSCSKALEGAVYFEGKNINGMKSRSVARLSLYPRIPPLNLILRFLMLCLWAGIHM